MKPAIQSGSTTGLLRDLQAAIVASEIVVRHGDDGLASWPPARDSADIEALILSWIASHAPAARSRGRVH